MNFKIHPWAWSKFYYLGFCEHLKKSQVLQIATDKGVFCSLWAFTHGQRLKISVCQVAKNREKLLGRVGYPV
jgi:hypothetical protein